MSLQQPKQTFVSVLTRNKTGIDKKSSRPSVRDGVRSLFKDEFSYICFYDVVVLTVMSHSSKVTYSVSVILYLL